MKVLKFYATWCEPCKMLSRIIEDAKDRITVPIQDINIEEDIDTALEYGVRSVPVMVMIDESGQEIKRQVGMVMEDKLLEFLTV